MGRKSRAGVPYVKTSTSKGKRYWYFDTGTLDARGKKVFAALPDIADKAAFGAAYSAMMGHRTRRSNAAAVITVASMIGLYRKGRDYTNLSDGSQRTYDIYLNELERLMGMAPAAEVTRADVVLMVDKRADKPGAANMLLKVTRALFKWARGRGHVTVDPCADIDLNELGEHLPWPEALLVQALAAEDERVCLAVHLLYYTAQRIGDVCSLKFSDIRDGKIHLKQQKTEKELEIPVHTRLQAQLNRTPRQIGPIIIGADGSAMNAKALRRIIQMWAKDRGAKIVPHGLRKNAVIALLEAGCTVAQTASISGQTLQLVEYYSRQRDQRKLAADAMRIWEGHKA